MAGAMILAAMVPTEAAVITTCSGSAGHAYVFVSPDGKSGWEAEDLGGREFQLVQEGKQLDIVLNDPSGSQSKKAQGFQVFSVPQSGKGYMLVMAIHSRGVVEHYLFQLDALGGGKVAWGSLKGAGWPVKKSALYEAKCQAP